ncbi:MAG: gamma-glutamyltransferase [Actinomycetota bacterium]
MKRPYLVRLGCACAAVVAVFSAGAPARSQARPPEPERGRRVMVATASDLATRVGVGILRKGGNAVDAAAAVGLALAVTYPIAGNLGGGGFLLLRTADGKTVAIDYREVAPARSRRDLYLDATGKVIPNASTTGYLAVGVPGTVAGLGLAVERYGKLKWRDVVEPARKLAAEGFPVSHTLARTLKASKLDQFRESRRIFLRDGKPYAEGEVFRQPDLARTLERLRDLGPREFYEGRTAELLAEDMRRHGGLITRQDLRSYKPVVRVPVRGTYRGYDVVTMPPPSSGGVALIQMLNMLERYDVDSLGNGSSAKAHVLTEVMRRAFADRAEFMGDPAFVKMPIRGLTSKRYAADLVKGIDLKKATPSTQVKAGRPAAYESPQTTHFSVVDAQGNAVSNTYTLNTAYGSGVTATGTGVLLNNEMDDFTSKPGVPNAFGLIQGEANAIQPGKRPLSSMTPTLVLKNGKLVLVVGSPGGPTIINTVLQTVVNVIDHRMNLRQAVSEPRIHHQWLPDTLQHEPFGMPRDVADALRRRGHQLAPEARYIGDVQAVMVEPGTGFRLGFSDPRSPDGLAAGF